MQALKTIIKPVITEKSSGVQADGKYIFNVRRDSNKKDVRKAIEETYGTEVKNIRMMILPKKTRLIKRGRLWTKRPVTKRAIVTLKGKKTIDPNKVAKQSGAKCK
ncbi:MAG: 50S ribosomal protein L23 [Candidatus Peregrinibacteria bacterium]